MHIFGIADIIFRDMPRRRNLMVLKADAYETLEELDYDTEEVIQYNSPIYTVLDLDTGQVYDMSYVLENGQKVA